MDEERETNTQTHRREKLKREREGKDRREVRQTFNLKVKAAVL